MALIVQKYGGTSVGSVERIQAVAEKVKQRHDRGDRVVVVVSAMSGETNRLVALARDIDEAPSAREMDVLVSTGEQVTIALLSMALHKLGVDARSYTGAQVRILTDDAYSKARIRDIDAAAVREDLEAGRVVVVAGFQGIDEDGNITTLGRGGTDTTRYSPTWTASTPPTPASNPRRESWSASPSRRCWRWPAWARRSCRSVRWSLPASTRYRCASCRGSRKARAP